MESIRYILLLAGIFFWLSYPIGALEKAETIEEVRMTTAEVEDVVMHGGTIFGKVVNKSDVTLKDVRLLVRHIWLWDNEYRPGRDIYSRAQYVPIEGMILPGESAEFSYTPVLPVAPGGHFETKVIVGEFTELPRQTAQR